MVKEKKYRQNTFISTPIYTIFKIVEWKNKNDKIIYVFVGKIGYYNEDIYKIIKKIELN